MSPTPSPLQDLLSRLDQMIALLEEQTYYLSLLIPGVADPAAETPAEPPPPSPPPAPRLLVICPNPTLGQMLVDWLNEDPGRRAQPSMILPSRIPDRKM